MGFSTSGATAIIFIGVLVAAGIAVPVLQTAQEERRAAIDERDDRALAMRNTAIEVASWGYNESGNNDFTMDVNNTGSTVLSVPETDLLIDGVYQGTYETSVDGTADRELWQPGETLTVTVSTSRPDRVKLVTEHGIAETVTGV
ncbi:flagellin [Natrinema sp. 1APR25-10V2]|uniref:flagellin n=1 Tax=Natrinema sp. 1APR25-10V2 TaxID=2951081 RepID=UPI002875F46E|nr:flagellin [Natrinema sp. 1APR25-10V2]MDS0476484.1 flagellin [Natrinema sp. 1APR25-10V2]